MYHIGLVYHQKSCRKLLHDIFHFIRDEMEDTDTHIAYISSKQSYAMELFKMQPLEFLVKPISAARLKEVLERSMKRKKYAESCFEYQRGSRIFRFLQQRTQNFIIITYSDSVHTIAPLTNIVSMEHLYNI